MARCASIEISDVTINNKTILLADPISIQVSCFGKSYYLENDEYDLFRIATSLDLALEQIKQDLFYKLEHTNDSNRLIA